MAVASGVGVVRPLVRQAALGRDDLPVLCRHAARGGGGGPRCRLLARGARTVGYGPPRPGTPAAVGPAGGRGVGGDPAVGVVPCGGAIRPVAASFAVWDGARDPRP